MSIFKWTADKPQVSNQTMSEQLIRQLPIGMYALDQQMRIIHWNPAAERITGYPATEVLGKKCSDAILRHINLRGESLCNGTTCPAAKTLKDGECRNHTLIFHHRNGKRIPIENHVAPLRDNHEQIIGVVETFYDCSKTIALAGRLKAVHKAGMIDELTHLPNRKYIETIMQKKLEQASTLNGGFGIMMIALDHLAKISSEYGADIGDELIKITTDTIARNRHDTDTLGRWGGGELVVLSEMTDRRALKEDAAFFRAIVNAMALDSDHALVRTSISIGLALALPGETANMIRLRAHDHMMQARQTGDRIIGP